MAHFIEVVDKPAHVSNTAVEWRTEVFWKFGPPLSTFLDFMFLGYFSTVVLPS
jgi:hypothetical protein